MDIESVYANAHNRILFYGESQPKNVVNSHIVFGHHSFDLASFSKNTKLMLPKICYHTFIWGMNVFSVCC